MSHKIFAPLAKRGTTAAAAVLTAMIVAAPHAHAQSDSTTPTEQTAAPGFFCNATALSPEERAFHKHLTEKLFAFHHELVELPKGYEFQFRPEDVSLADLAQWVVAEEKCCPFFNFHIDLENRGTRVCLGLTGAEGVKTFILSEFNVPEVK
jgi:hypothetical protein